MDLHRALLVVEAGRLAPPLRSKGARSEAALRWTPEHDRFLRLLPSAVLARIWKMPLLVVGARKRRVAPRQSRLALVWTEAMLADLGRMRDPDFARRHRVSSPAVCKKRQSLGIPPYRPPAASAWTAAMRQAAGLAKHDVPPEPPWRHPAIRARLGTAPDGRLAHQWKTKHRLVTAWRTEAGIPPISRRRWTKRLIALLGRISDTDLARQIGLNSETVRYHRQKRGIPVFRRGAASRAKLRGSRPSPARAARAAGHGPGRPARSAPSTRRGATAPSVRSARKRRGRDARPAAG